MSHQCPELSSAIPRVEQRLLSQRVSFPPPTPRFSRRPAWLHGDNRLSRLSLTPLLAPRAPATVVCSTLSHLTGHLHSVRKRLTPNLHVKSVFMNRSDRKNPAKTLVNGKEPEMSPVWKLHMMTYNVTPLREILLKWIASRGQELPARSGRG